MSTQGAMAGPVHYEIHIRRAAPDDWSLSHAVEDRRRALDAADDLMRDRQAVAVRVTRETLDPETMEFASAVILTRGAPMLKRRPIVAAPPRGPACRSVRDLYAPHARETIGQVLEGWLTRHEATAFELLHRPDLAERLEASGVELQHAIQKVAAPEARSMPGQSVHELMRHYQRLTEQAVERLLKAGRSGAFADLRTQPVADVAVRLAGSSERAFRMGGAVAASLRGLEGARARLERLMDLCDQAPPAGPPRALVFVPVEQILCEILGSGVRLAQLLGPGLDPGVSLAAAVRMAAPAEVAALIADDPRLCLSAPPVDGPPARLGARLAAGEFPLLTSALARVVQRELMGRRRLRPGDAAAEIDTLRLLAMALTATAGRLLTLEEVQTAFTERSRSLVAADFVAACVADCATVLAEAERLTWLCENVTGAANKRAAARWLNACLGSLRFENELRGRTATNAPLPGQRLLALADLQRAVDHAGLPQKERQAIVDALGQTGGAIEADARLTAQIARSAAPIPQKLAALLRLATGETGPTGPAAERARNEAVRLMRGPDARAALSAEPKAVQTLKPLMQAAGLAA